MTVRTSITNRPFPFTCHAVCTPMKPVFAFFVVLGGVVLISAFVAMTFDQPEDEPLRRLYFLTWIGFWLCGYAGLPFRLGFREVLPNRVVNVRGATWILPRPAPIELLVSIIAGALVTAGAIIYIQVLGGLTAVLGAGTRPVILGPVMACLGASMILVHAWQQLRGIKLTPEGITYWRGIGKITLAWDELGDAVSTNDVRDHEGYRKHLNKYMPGAKITVPVERAMGVRLRVHWEDVDTPRLLLETGYYTVEPSSLLTAILALRDHPELRSLLGTRASRLLFRGPPWRVRRHLYRTQQWWPKGAVPDGIAVDADGVVKEFQ